MPGKTDPHTHIYIYIYIEVCVRVDATFAICISIEKYCIAIYVESCIYFTIFVLLLLIIILLLIIMTFIG